MLAVCAYDTIPQPPNALTFIHQLCGYTKTVNGLDLYAVCVVDVRRGIPYTGVENQPILLTDVNGLAWVEKLPDTCIRNPTGLPSTRNIDIIVGD